MSIAAFDRRGALRLGAGVAALAALPGCGGEAASYAPRPDGWRRYRLTTTLSVPRDGAPAQAWVPVPALTEGQWARAGEARWTTNADEARLVTDPAGLRFVHAVWGPGSGPAELTVTAEASAQDRAVDFDARGVPSPLPEAERARLTAPTDLIPTDGIVERMAARITEGADTDLAKARALYDWVVENTARNPKTRGCGPGDVATMLEIGDLTGKCADINALFVGLARASGLPARDLYGVRVAPSEEGYRSLGASPPDVTKAQHCRADVYLTGHGWVPVDPADVRKVMLEEADDPLGLRAPKVRAARRGLFGASEGNWVAYNAGHDVDLPGAEGPRLAFLMYPQAEARGVRLDPLAPDSFAYRIQAEELTA